MDQSITYNSRDELGTLATNFNKTVGRLRNYVNYIDEISSVLRQIAGGNLVFELTLDYEGEFAKVKQALDRLIRLPTRFHQEATRYPLALRLFLKGQPSRQALLKNWRQRLMRFPHRLRILRRLPMRSAVRLIRQGNR